MESIGMIELSDVEVEEVSGGLPVAPIVVAVIALAGAAVGAYNEYKSAQKGK